jgi:hypothetical protein
MRKSGFRACLAAEPWACGESQLSWLISMSNFPEIEWQNQPYFERPVFISYCARDFRIAYALLNLILTPEERKAPGFDQQVLMDFPLATSLPLMEGAFDQFVCLTGEKEILLRLHSLTRQ